MKYLAITLLIGLAAQSAGAAGNNYADMERKEQQRLEKSRRDAAQREKDNARFNREYKERMSNYNNKNSQGSSASKPGRMMDIKP